MYARMHECVYVCKISVCWHVYSEVYVYVYVYVGNVCYVTNLRFLSTCYIDFAYIYTLYSQIHIVLHAHNTYTHTYIYIYTCAVQKLLEYMLYYADVLPTCIHYTYFSSCTCINTHTNTHIYMRSAKATSW